MTNASTAQDMRVSNCMDKTLKQLAAREQSEPRYTLGAGDLQHHEACPACSSGKVQIISRVSLEGLDFFNTAACEECLHVFRSTSPSRPWFQARWAQIVTGKLEVFNPELEALRAVRYGQYYDILKPYVPTGRLLDVGAAYGNGAKTFMDRGYEVEAVEIEDDRALYIRETLGIPVYHTPLEELEPPKTNYDAILFAHVLEHLDDPVAMLRKLKRWLNPDRGVLYLEIPILWQIADWKDAFFMAHKHNFSEENIAKLARREGFTVVKKLLVKDSEADFDNLALLLTLGNAYPAEADTPCTLDKPGATVADVAALYHKGLPAPADLTEIKALQFHVPYINHFYYVVRAQQGHWEAKGNGNYSFVRDVP